MRWDVGCEVKVDGVEVQLGAGAGAGAGIGTDSRMGGW